jgi:serine acetyltransferase
MNYHAIIHSTAIIEPDVVLGPGANVGYYSIIRGNVRAGRNLRLGSHASIEGDVVIGDDVTIRGKCEIPNSIIGDRVNIYSGVKFYDTPHPPDGPNLPPVIEDDVTICCDTAILGGVTVGAGSFIGARVFLTESVPPGSLVTAVSPVKIRQRRRAA